MPTLSPQQIEKLSERVIPEQVNAFEREVLFAIREVSYGSIEIDIRAGNPRRIVKHNSKEIFREE